MIRTLARWSGIHRASFVLLGLLTVASVGGVMGLREPTPEAIDVDFDQLLRAPPVGKRVRVSCERIDMLGDVVKGRDVEIHVALCVVGDRLLPVTIGPDTRFPNGAVAGPLVAIRGSEVWVREGIRKNVTIARRNLDVYVDARPREDETLPVLGFVVGTLALWVWWIVAYRQRRQRRAREAAHLDATFVPRRTQVSGPRSKGSSMPPPDALKGKVRFATALCEVSAAGLDARREDGVNVLVSWSDVVGVVARRLPASLSGAPFVDVVSTQGATLRILPWTKLTGDAIAWTDDNRPRVLVETFAMRCPSAKLDQATQAFTKSGEPLQLPDTVTLDQHDQMLS